MRVLLLHLDGKLPNLALMRLAAHHRDRGDDVELARADNDSALEAALEPDLFPYDKRIPWDAWAANDYRHEGLGETAPEPDVGMFA